MAKYKVSELERNGVTRYGKSTGARETQSRSEITLAKHSWDRDRATKCEGKHHWYEEDTNTTTL